MGDNDGTELWQLNIKFEGLSTAEAGRASGELQHLLAPIVGPKGSVEITRTSNETQDMGTSLVLILGTPSAIAIAKGIHDYIARLGNRVTILTPEGQVLATGDAAKNIDIAKTIAAIRGYAKRKVR